MAVPTPAAPRRILLVEGPDDRSVIDHLRNRHESLPSFEIEAKGGIKPLLAAIGPEVKVPGRRAIGVVVDADRDAEARWASVVDRLAQIGIEVGGLDPLGTIIPRSPAAPTIGVWMMPDNRSPGEIEDFIRTMVPTEDPVWPLAEDYIDGIPPAHRAFTSPKTLRAKVHAWLATRARPRLMGTAIAANDLDITGENCRTLLAWLQRLFAEGS